MNSWTGLSTDLRTTKTFTPKRHHLLTGPQIFNLSPTLFSCVVHLSDLSVCCQKKKFPTDPNATEELIGSLPTCQEPLWSFFSGRQTGRRSSRSRSRRCHSRRASSGKHQTRFLRGTFHCPWTPLGHETEPAEGRQARKVVEFKGQKENERKWSVALHSSATTGSDFQWLHSWS